MADNDFYKILKNKNCRGCSNRCSLLYPGCNRSKIYIDEERKKYEGNKNNLNDLWENFRLF